MLRKDWWIEDEINAYLDAGFPAEGRLELHRSDFHGGGLRSKHRTLRGAVLAQWRRLRHTDCICGCLVLVAPDIRLEKERE